MLKDEELLFKVLNQKLKEKNQFLELLCVGGFVMNHYSMRTTMDIDSFYTANKEVQDIIIQMGNEYDLNPKDEIWLNNSVQNMNKKPPREICSVIYDLSNLKVMIPPLDYIACMKLYSAREQDIKDVAEIIKAKPIKTPEDMEKILKKYHFNEIDESILLEAFGEAYGMEWLEEYYIKKYNPEYVSVKNKKISDEGGDDGNQDITADLGDDERDDI